MEGYLTIPPDRGSILGRAVWKTRYVVIGSAQGEVTEGKGQTGGSSHGRTFLSIYKNPDDWEPSQQYAVSNVTQCQVQIVAHRKQMPALPTLILTIAPDPLTEKIRKRRSSRAATLVSNKDNGPTTLWFRTEGDASRLHEWAACIQSIIQPSLPDNLPMSPMSPGTPLSPSFQNPFGQVFHRETSDTTSFRPPSAPKATLHHKTSSSLHISRQRPLTISDAPSLRSRRSDLSSLISTTTAGTATTHSYTPKLPTDLPSPAETPTDAFGGFIEGWTSAQGRSSALHSPVRIARDSEDSNPPLSPAAILDSGSPPGRGETILDRAFQMKYIPGSDLQIPGEEKLSSLARFEALMQEVDARRMNKRQTDISVSMAQQLELKSAWDGDESEEEEDDDSDDDVDNPYAESDGTDEDLVLEQDLESNMSAARHESRRAIVSPRREGATRREERGGGGGGGGGAPETPVQSPRSPAGPRSPISYNPETLAALSSGSSRGGVQRTHSSAHSVLGAISLGVAQGAAPPDASPGKTSILSENTTTSEESTGGLNPSSAYRTSTIAEGRERHSTTSSGRRLSFTEFTRRLSSTSNKLLSQTGGGYGDPTAVADERPKHKQQQQQQQQQPQHQIPSRRSSVMQPRAPPSMFSPPRSDVQDRSEKCKSMRSSVGMFGNEGGLM